jgi:hypothetical protein
MTSIRADILSSFLLHAVFPVYVRTNSARGQNSEAYKGRTCVNWAAHISVIGILYWDIRDEFSNFAEH